MKEHSPRKKTRIIKKCGSCDKTMSVRLTQEKSKKYCSSRCYWDNLKNKPSLLKGRVGRYSQETKNRIRNSVTQRWKEGTYAHRPNLSHKNEENPGWKGGITPINKRIRRSSQYKHWRQAVFSRDHWTCQHCNKRGGKLHADHIKPFAKYPVLRFDINNGQTLCIPCHKKKTFPQKISKGDDNAIVK